MTAIGFLTVLGGTIVTATMIDFLVTTVSLKRSGPISSVTARITGRLIRAAPGPLSSWSGPFSLVAVATVWIILLWTGWTLVFADAMARLTGPDGSAVGPVDVIAFSGSTISTMGMGVVTPTAGIVHVGAVVASITGMVVMTLAVSFILNVCQIAVLARTLALRFGDLRSLLHLVSARSGTALLLDQSMGLAADAHGLAESRESFPLSREYDPAGEKRDVADAAGRLCDEIRLHLNHVIDTDDRARLDVLTGTIDRLRRR